MEYRKLGSTDIEVSKICLGTMTYGEQNTEAEGHKQMDYALDHGVNFFDTAELYAVPANPQTQGLTEKYIGTWLNASGNRDKIVLATKIAGPGDYTRHIRDVDDYSSASIIAAVEGSLSRLQTDYIDLYQLHWPARKTNFFGVRGYRHAEGWEDNFHDLLNTLAELIKSGKIRHIGISNETPWGIMNMVSLAKQHDLPRIVSVQNPYSLLNRLYEIGSAEVSIREQAGLLAYSPLAFGMLTGKYHNGTATPESRITKFARMSRYSNENCKNATSQYIAIAKKYNLSVTQMSLAFINQQQFLTSNIIGATNLEQLKENIGSAEVELSRECIKEINAVHESIPNPAP